MNTTTQIICGCIESHDGNPVAFCNQHDALRQERDRLAKELKDLAFSNAVIQATMMGIQFR